MKKIVFLTGNYYPDHSAVSNCVEKVILSLENDYKVSVICPSSSVKNTEIIEHKRHQIIKFPFKNEELKIFRRTRRVLNKFSLDNKLIEGYLNELIKITDIDLIVPAAMPYETIFACNMYVKNSISRNNIVKYAPYLFDPYFNSKTLHYFEILKKLKINYLNMFEKETLLQADRIIMIDHLKDYYKNKYINYRKKMIFVEHPLFIPKKIVETEKDKSDIINILYAGSFYKKIRNPENLLAKLKELCDINHKIEVNLYSFGDCDSILKKYESNKIKNHGSISSSESYIKMENADVLLALGNTIVDQAPSKIFEYMSLNKKIIYIYKNHSDTNIQILKKYPKVLIMHDKKIDIIRINKFLKNTDVDNMQIDLSDEVFEKAKPSYTKKKLIEII